MCAAFTLGAPQEHPSGAARCPQAVLADTQYGAIVGCAIVVGPDGPVVRFVLRPILVVHGLPPRRRLGPARPEPARLVPVVLDPVVLDPGGSQPSRARD